MHLKKNIAISESGFVFNSNTGDSFTINTMGVTIIKLINQSLPEDEIIDEIIKIYDIDKGTAERDFQEFTHLLMQHNLMSN